MEAGSTWFQRRLTRNTFYTEELDRTLGLLRHHSGCQHLGGLSQPHFLKQTSQARQYLLTMKASRNQLCNPARIFAWMAEPPGQQNSSFIKERPLPKEFHKFTNKQGTITHVHESMQTVNMFLVLYRSTFQELPNSCTTCPTRNLEVYVYVHTHIRTYIHTCTHTCMHTYMHAPYIYSCVCA